MVNDFTQKIMIKYVSFQAGSNGISNFDLSETLNIFFYGRSVKKLYSVFSFLIELCNKFVFLIQNIIEKFGYIANVNYILSSARIYIHIIYMQQQQNKMSSVSK